MKIRGLLLNFLLRVLAMTRRFGFRNLEDRTHKKVIELIDAQLLARKKAGIKELEPHIAMMSEAELEEHGALWNK